MGKTFSTGLLTNGIWQDASNNIGIGAANSSFKFQVTGTTNLTGALGGTSATFSSTLGITGAATFSNNVNIGGSTTDRLGVTGTGGTTGFVRFTDGVTAALFFGVNSGTPYLHSNNNTLSFGASGANTFAPTMTLSSGNVGIGTSSIANGTSYGGGGQVNRLKVASGNYTCLEINGNTSGGSIQFTYGVDAPNQVAALIAYNYASGSVNEMNIINALGGAMTFGTNNTERMRITSGGNVLIGYTGASSSRLVSLSSTNTSSSYAAAFGNSSAADLLLVRGDGLITFPSVVSTWTTGNAANVWANPSSGDLYRSTSSIKYKKNVKNYTRGLAEVMQLRPVSYEGKHEVDNGKTFAGLIAEEVHELGLTEFVQYAEDGTPDALAYQNMIALAFKAIQELKLEIDELKNK